jgi:hypothetical protein
VLVVNGGHAQEHEDDRLGAARQHLHRVLDRRLRVARYIALHVVLNNVFYAVRGGRMKLKPKHKKVHDIPVFSIFSIPDP